MPTLLTALKVALDAQEVGQVDEAISVYRQIIAQVPDCADAYHLLGSALHESGALSEAASVLRQAVHLKPGVGQFHNTLAAVLMDQQCYAEALESFTEAVRLLPSLWQAELTLGMLLQKMGRPAQAEHHCRKALAVNPASPEAHNNLGNALLAQNRGGEAIESLRKAVSLRPDYADARVNLAGALLHENEPAEAAECCRLALVYKPDSIQALVILGKALLEADDFNGAMESFERARALRPNLPDFEILAASAHHKAGRLDDAEGAYRRYIADNPVHGEALVNLSAILNEQGQHEEAAALARRALDLKQDSPPAHTNLGNALGRLGQLDEAEKEVRAAVALDPGYAPAYLNLGVVLHRSGRPRDAVEAWRTAVRLEPGNADSHLNLAMGLLALGHMHEGWDEYEWRWKTKQCSYSELPGRAWNGEPFQGKTLLLIAEQGLGDTIQFARYARLAKERGGTVLLQCQHHLVKLLRNLAGVDGIVPVGIEPSFDLHAPLLGLPRIFGTDLTNIPAAAPYLEPPTAWTEAWRWRVQTSGKRSVGLVWAAGPRQEIDRMRSVPRDLFAALAGIPNVQFFSLQRGPETAHLPALEARLPVTNLEAGPANIVDTAAAIQNLDLLISVDTMTAHLAGALGKPVWTLLPFAPDFRWLLDRNDTPWYPTMRLFRQPRPGDWTSVITNVRKSLECWAAEPVCA